MKGIYIKKYFKIKDVDSFTFNQFVKILGAIWEEKDDEKFLEDAFKAIDTEDAGYLSVDQLKDALVGFGEKMDEEEFKEFLKNVPIQTDGNINNSGKIIN